MTNDKNKDELPFGVYVLLLLVLMCLSHSPKP